MTTPRKSKFKRQKSKLQFKIQKKGTNLDSCFRRNDNPFSLSSPPLFCHTCVGRCPGLYSVFCVLKKQGKTWIPAYAGMTTPRKSKFKRQKSKLQFKIQKKGTNLDSCFRRNDNPFSLSSPPLFCHTCVGRCPGLYSVFCVLKKQGKTWIPAYAGMTTPLRVTPAKAGVQVCILSSVFCVLIPRPGLRFSTE